MKNLIVQYHKIYDIKEQSEQIFLQLQDDLQSPVVCCTHPVNDKLFIIGNNNLYSITFDKDSMLLFHQSNIINNDTNAKAIGVEYWIDHNMLAVAYDTGDFVKIIPEQPFSSEVVAHFSGGLSCIQLSPDQEILVLVTRDHKVVTMISTLEIISEVSLISGDFGEKQFITVGWGHKATQFHGSEGKNAATAHCEITGKTDRDSGKSYITWRGDGVLFAVSFLNKQNNSRQFKVFNREGVLQYTSELISGLEEMISWRPSGNYIAGTQQLTDKGHIVVLFEKNGLKYRDFCLPFNLMEVEVKHLTWSPDSKILTIWVEKNKKSIIQLWTMNNGHRYLKQTIELPEDNPLIYLTWSTAINAGNRLILLTKIKVMIYIFRWTISHSRGIEANDNAVAGVIDGNKIRLTEFKMGVLPPPMCHHFLGVNSAINECFFAPRCQDASHSWLNPNVFCLLLQNNELALFIYENNSSPKYEHVGYYQIEWSIPQILDANTPYAIHHFMWFKADTILCSVTVSSGRCSYLAIIQLENIREENGRIIVRETFKMDGYIQHIVPSPDVNIAYIFVDNRVLKYIHGEGVKSTEIIIPESCDSVEVLEIDERHVIVSLERTNRLFINGAEVANNITSLFVHSDFLLLTTRQHTLVTVALNSHGLKQIPMTNLTVQSWTNDCIEENTTDLNIRRLERSSSLIMALRDDSKVILQAQRGNFETIQPRPLSLHIIKSHLSVLNYFEAFDIMRKHRINLNLIYDHNPTLFIKNAEKFVDDIKNSQWLNLFISDLHEEDTAETIYTTCYIEQEHELRKRDYEVPEEGKVEMICQLLRGIMEKKAAKRNFVQPILTSLVKNKQTSGFEAALRKINEFKVKEGISKTQQSADEAFNYLLYLVDVDVLYNIALGMYDLELAKFVASKSQKDPKEYLLYLNELSELEENYRKFQIDKNLKRYESALQHIAKRLDKFDECTEFICNHDLYSKAIQIFPSNGKEYKKISNMYGQFLLKNRYYREAGLMFQRSGDWDRALEAYERAGSWQNCIIVSTYMNMSPMETSALYVKLVTQLKDDKRYRDAAEISMTYLDQPEEAVSLLCEGKEWKDALKISHTSERLDLIETHVKPGAQEFAIDMLERINRSKEEFVKLKKRLILLRKEKKKNQRQLFDALDKENPRQEYNDLLSEMGSNAGSQISLVSKASTISGKSYKSSKNKRKQERKMLSIKEGSAFEDLALIRGLHIIISNTYAQRSEVSELIRMLVNFYLDELAEKVQNALIEFLNIIEESKLQIWIKDLTTQGLQMNEFDMSTPSHLLDPKFTYPPDAASCNWILKIFSSRTLSSTKVTGADNV